MGYQLTVVVLEVSQHIHHGVVGEFCSVIVDVCEMQFLDHFNDFLHKSLLDSRHFSKHTHFLGVCDLRVGISMGGCDVWDDERTWVSQVEKGSG